MRNGALRRGDCLSEASLSTFSEMKYNFSKIRAALTFWFFCVKAKEQTMNDSKQDCKNKIREALNFCFFWFKPKEKENNKLERQ